VGTLMRGCDTGSWVHHRFANAPYATIARSIANRARRPDTQPNDGLCTVPAEIDRLYAWLSPVSAGGRRSLFQSNACEVGVDAARRL